MSTSQIPEASEPWHGWESYPANLSSSICSPFVYDHDFIGEKLAQDSSRLFITGDCIRIRVIEVGVQELIIKSTKALEEYLLESRNFDGIRIIMIAQQSSWGPLTINSEAARKLFTSLAVFTELLTILNTFGRRTCLQSDGYSSYPAILHTQPENYECAYHLRYVEEHRREEEIHNPWSIRHMGIYHKSRAKPGNHDFILFNTPKHLQGRLIELLTKPNPGVNSLWQDMHLILFSCASRNWSSYVDWVDEKFKLVKLKAYSATNTHTPSTKSWQKPDISISDAQDIELIRNNICDAKRYLAANCTVFTAINDMISHTRLEPAVVTNHIHSKSTTARGHQHINTHINLAREQIERLSTTLEMLESTSTLVHRIAEIWSLEAVEENAYIATDLSQKTEAGNRLMFEIAKKSYKDAYTLKMITIVTLMYLPVSFIAQFLSAGYVTLGRDQTGRIISLHVSEDIVIFIVLSVVLLAVTLSVWRVLERRHQVIDQKRATFYLQNP